MEGEDDLDILTSLLVENEDELEEPRRSEGQEGTADLDGLFDDEDEEDYSEGPDEERGGAKQHEAFPLFGDVEDLEEVEEEEEEGSAGRPGNKTSDRLDVSKEDLEAELKRMQERMQRLQRQLEDTQAPAPQAPAPPRADAPPRAGASPKHKASTPPDVESRPVRQRVSSSQPLRTNGNLQSPPPKALPQLAPPPALLPPPKAHQAPPTRDVAVEKFSGLRLRKPLVSSVEMERKMADRRLIRLSQLPDRIAREKLEDSDWVTFAVVVSKITPQSNSSGKTFSIWKLNDLHDLEVYVSLFLFGEVHREHWKTHPGTVIGILNPNPMKSREGSDGVCLSVDHVQKILLMGEAQDFGTCKASKKNGQPCSQLVNLHECQFCQYHVKAQYRKMSSKRAELQSSFSGKVPGKAQGGRGRGGASLKERLCHSGFHYGGVSSPACAASLAASQPKKPSQTRLSGLFIRGADQIASQAKRVAMQADQVTGCSDDFRSLLSLPTPGALNLKQHLTQAKPTGSAAAGVQSISASQLLKQQKQQMLESRRRRAESRVLQRGGAGGVEGAGLPSLGRGLAQGDDVLFFDHTPPPPPHSLSAAKLAALKKLRQKGGAIAREDPNSVKRKRADSAKIASRVEKNLQGDEEEAEPDEPALKRQRERLDYLQSPEFQKILSAKSRHTGALQAAEFQLQEQYFEPLLKKEQMEEKMRSIREMKCRAVTCKTCKYTYFKPLDTCVERNHEYHWHDAVKRFFRCPCGQRAIALDRLPHKHCSNCGLFKWERDTMLKEKSGPKIAGELLLPRGEEQPKFLSSMK